MTVIQSTTLTERPIGAGARALGAAAATSEVRYGYSRRRVLG
jgi:hypothetical protein